MSVPTEEIEVVVINPTATNMTTAPTNSTITNSKKVFWFLFMWNVVTVSGLAEALERFLSLEDAFGLTPANSTTEAPSSEPTPTLDPNPNSFSPALLWSVIALSLIAWLTISATVHSHMTGRAEELDQEREKRIAEKAGITWPPQDPLHPQSLLKTVVKRGAFIVLCGFSIILAGGSTYQGGRKFFESWFEPSLGLSLAMGYVAAMRTIALMYTDLLHAKEHLWEKTPHAHLPLSTRLKLTIYAARIAIFSTHALYGIYESEAVIGPWLRKILGDSNNGCDWRTILAMLPFTSSQAIATSLFESDHIPTFIFKDDLSFWKKENILAAGFAFLALGGTLVNAAGHAVPSVAGSNTLFSCLNISERAITITVNAVLAGIEVVLDCIVHHRYLDDVASGVYNKLVQLSVKLRECYPGCCSTSLLSNLYTPLLEKQPGAIGKSDVGGMDMEVTGSGANRKLMEIS